MKSILLCVVLVVGCGRISFETRALTDSGSTDGNRMDASGASDGGDEIIDASADAASDARADATIDASADAASDARVDASRCSSATLVITADVDDGEIDEGLGFLQQGENDDPGNGTPAGVYIGFWNGGPTWGFFRFELPPGLVSGASVRRAHLLLEGTGTLQWQSNSHALRTYLEQSADSPVVTQKSERPGDTQGRIVGPAVRWPASGGLDWQVGAPNQGPDLSAELESLLGSFSIGEGAHIQLWLESDQAVFSEVVTHDFGRGSGQPAQLFVEWCR